ncbi:MAG: S8 family serine peptidase, partial [Planctomycetia bacterium]
MDEGIDINHPDLKANIWVNPREIAGDRIDNDGNGYVDDINGWDFFSKDNTVYGGTGDDHGTHVAGTIGGVGGNGVGVAGVNWNVTMISAKFLGPTGGYTSDAVSALDYLTDLKTRYGVNIVASNNSWGGGGYSSALHGAIIRSANANILFVAAAGKGGSDGIGDSNDSVANYPSNYSTLLSATGQPAASYESVIAVAALTSTGGLASYSNFGATTVDIGAPGSGIWSTLPGNTYGSYSGTSMATPHVTGSVALYASAYPNASAAAIRDAILSSARPTASLAGKTVTGGRLDVAGALNVTPPIGISITGGSVAEGDSGTTQLTFTVTLSAASAGTVTVNYATANGTATSGSDYVAQSGPLSFAPGETSKTILVDVIGDTTYEPNETFSIALSGASSNA